MRGVAKQVDPEKKLSWFELGLQAGAERGVPLLADDCRRPSEIFGLFTLLKEAKA